MHPTVNILPGTISTLDIVSQLVGAYAIERSAQLKEIGNNRRTGAWCLSRSIDRTRSLVANFAAFSGRGFNM
jgi:hypothetical protein